MSFTLESPDSNNLSTKVIPSPEPPSLSDQISNQYYTTTAQRSHAGTRSYYEECASSLLRGLGNWLPDDKRAACLDLACGCGEFIYAMEGRGFDHTTGVDLCEAELEQARVFVKGTLCEADVLEYLREAESESFDFITALNLLEHLPKDKLLAVMNECRRVLRPGGYLVAMVPNAVSPFGSLTRYWDITHEWAFTTNNFRQLAALVGFDGNVEFRECGPRPHGVVSAARFLLWQGIRAAIMTWFLIELGTTKDGIYTMDMLVRLRAPKEIS